MKVWIGYCIGAIVGFALAFGLGVTNVIALTLFGGTFALVGLLIGARLQSGD